MDLEGLGITVNTPRLRLTVPPECVRDLQKLLALESDGFLPASRVHYDADQGGFVLELHGNAVGQVLDLLTIATDCRDAETWAQRLERERAQMSLSFTAADEPLDTVWP
jgi:hypothetical protein